MNDRLNDGAIAQSDIGGDRPFNKLPVSVQKWFGLFHVWDFITADAPTSSQIKLQWKSTGKYPLNDPKLYRIWQSSEQFIGVRFETKKDGKTRYLVLDIDRGSQYHPYTDATALVKLLEVLESIGLHQYIRIRSSASEGIHIYFPLNEGRSCDGLAQAVFQTLTQQEFVIKAGQLELFPNVRSASKTNYMAHRLPLQAESFVLDEDWQPVHNSIEQLVNEWNAIALVQDLERLDEAIATHRSYFKKTGSSKGTEEWRSRLEDTLSMGWTDSGQTNQIIQEACTYARVFVGLEWNEVESWVLSTIPSLPGYRQYCGHQSEIDCRVRDWVVCNQKSNRYHPIGAKAKPKVRKAPLNEDRSADAKTRLEEAIAFLKAEMGKWPNGVKARMRLIRERAKCSPQTLYKHKSLWHPEFDPIQIIASSVVLCSVSASVYVMDSSYQRCVTPDQTENVVTNSKSIVNVVSQRCVTPDRTGDLATNPNIPSYPSTQEVQPDSRVTHPSLLSVSSSVGSSEEILEEQENVPSIVQTYRVGDIVRWKKFGTTFKVKSLNSNGTLWAKHLNQITPKVDVILRADELELVEACSKIS